MKEMRVYFLWRFVEKCENVRLFGRVTSFPANLQFWGKIVSVDDFLSYNLFWRWKLFSKRKRSNKLHVDQNRFINFALSSTDSVPKKQINRQHSFWYFEGLTQVYLLETFRIHLQRLIVYPSTIGSPITVTNQSIFFSKNRFQRLGATSEQQSFCAGKQ